MPRSGLTKDFIDIVKDTQITCTLDQLVNEFTRIQKADNVINRSAIDHIYSNCGQKLSSPVITPIGDSDHLGISITKVNHLKPERPVAIRIRDYKKLDVAALLDDIYQNNINKLIMNIDNMNEASYNLCNHGVSPST